LLTHHIFHLLADELQFDFETDKTSSTSPNTRSTLFPFIASSLSSSRQPPGPQKEP
jgi:hypothetical protein